MSLFWHLTIHVVLAVTAGIVAWKFYNKRPYVAIFWALVGGVAIDLDHYIDYMIAFGLTFDMEYFTEGYQFFKNGKMYVLFHGWEYIVLCFIIIKFTTSKLVRTISLALALGMFVHLTADVVMNEIPFRGYSFAYRVIENFDVGMLIDDAEYQSYLRERQEKQAIFDNF